MFGARSMNLPFLFLLIASELLTMIAAKHKLAKLNRNELFCHRKVLLRMTECERSIQFYPESAVMS